MRLRNTVLKSGIVFLTLILGVALIFSAPVQLTTVEGRQNQIIINTSRIENIQTRQQIDADRITVLETRVASLDKAQNPQDIATVTLALKVEELTQLVHWTIGLLITLCVGFIGRVIWDVVGTGRPSRGNSPEMEE